MTIDEELSIIRDNIAEYGQTNITQEEYNMIYNKAIDDFAEKIIRYVDCGHLCQPTEMRWSDFTVVEMIKKKSEQLKAGVDNGA